MVADFVGQAGESDSLFIGVDVEMKAESFARWEIIFVPWAASVNMVADKLREMLG